MLSYALETKVGYLYLQEQEGAITRLTFMDPPGSDYNRERLFMEPSAKDGQGTKAPSSLLQEAESQLLAYFEGKLKQFNLPLNPAGTEFQKKVWAALERIPYGTTASYKDIAQKVGSPKGFRAVGLANNRNPIAIVIPCHRVVGSNGKMVGYAGGLDVKQALLRIEGGLL